MLKKTSVPNSATITDAISHIPSTMEGIITGTGAAERSPCGLQLSNSKKTFARYIETRARSVMIKERTKVLAFANIAMMKSIIRMDSFGWTEWNRKNPRVSLETMVTKSVLMTMTMKKMWGMTTDFNAHYAFDRPPFIQFNSILNPPAISMPLLA
jgi:hypothetical protein